MTKNMRFFLLSCLLIFTSSCGGWTSTYSCKGKLNNGACVDDVDNAIRYSVEHSGANAQEKETGIHWIGSQENQSSQKKDQASTGSVPGTTTWKDELDARIRAREVEESETSKIPLVRPPIMGRAYIGPWVDGTGVYHAGEYLYFELERARFRGE